MAGVNKVFLLGNLGRDPELRFTSNNTPVCQLNVATTRSYTDRGGQQQSQTEWHRVVVWGQQGERCAQYLSKGRQVFVEGRLQTRSYQDRDGNKRYVTEVVADNVQFLGGGRGGRGEGDVPPPSGDDFGAGPSFGDDMGGGGVADDDIPF
ncbi:MAG: single-stranded DNA-binding protein [Deltaproteobacteria bacterium]|nr:MAG: single-stranded DNA-binding protein [Deltaproteobacteria bacterium]